MSTLAVDVEPLAIDGSCTDDSLRVVLADGREITVPLIWSQRLQKVTPKQRNEWRLIGGGIGSVSHLKLRCVSPNEDIDTQRKATRNIQ